MAVSLTIAAIFLYPIICISCTYPPIKNYTYNGTMSNLVSGIQNYAYTNPHIILTITDTTGAEKDNPAIYFNVEISKPNQDILYNLECERRGFAIRKTQTEIKLIGAFNRTNTSGGYKIEDLGVKSLVTIFDSNFLSDLKKQTNISVVPN